MSSVAIQNDSKLNQLLTRLPEGLVVDAAWMERNGYSRQLRSQYVAAGWLEQPVSRVYCRPRGVPGWEAVVVSMQTLLDLPLVVGGRTALQVQGVSHYLAQEMRQVHLYGPVPLPTWLTKLPLNIRFHHHNSDRLFQPEATPRGSLSATLAADRQPGWRAESVQGLRQITWGSWDLPMTLSTPERAILELLDELPDRESFHQADKLMEGLPNLSPRRLAQLLTDCRSVKVKRLFFFFADRHAHAWRGRLRPEDFDLGAGKRVLVKRGKLDRRYQITVPEDLDGVS